MPQRPSPAKLRNAGSLDELQALLAPVYGAFGEGFATRDLALARALLEQVDAPASRIDAVQARATRMGPKASCGSAERRVQ